MDKKWITGEDLLRAHEEYMASVEKSGWEYADAIPGLNDDERKVVAGAYCAGRRDEMDRIMMDYLKRKDRL